MLWRLFQLAIVLGVVAVEFLASRDSGTQSRPDLAIILGMMLAYIATVFVAGVLNVVTLLRGKAVGWRHRDVGRAAVAGSSGLEALSPHIAEAKREHGELRLRGGGNSFE